MLSVNESHVYVHTLLRQKMLRTTYIPITECICSLIRCISLNIIKFLLINTNGQVTVVHTKTHHKVTHTQGLHCVSMCTSSDADD